MHYTNPIYTWKIAPFIRLVVPLAAGILLCWYYSPPMIVLVMAFGCFVLASGLFYLFPLGARFKLQSLRGILFNLVLISFGGLCTWNNDIRHNNNWFAHYYRDSDYLAVRINEPLVEKAKSYKADGLVEYLIQDDSSFTCKGKLLLYFSKDSNSRQLQYGDIILLNKKLQAIKNTGNPGAFDYQRYASFQHVFHNVYLKEGDWIKLEQHHTNPFKQFIFQARNRVLSVLKTNIQTADELAIAEALLIGYTNDLDKDLVQAYSNTGVVHIIAISGMHLGLIYVLLVWIFSKIPLLNRSKLLQVILILACLWTFSLMTGASASVTRAAVMFTFIAVGKSFQKQASIYNSLAGSAFVMLCYNPYFLWDVGFQLSYLAVVGIIIFQQPVYSWLYIKNKWLDQVWKLAAISLAAQVFTFPVCIYYFHQFPNFFLLTNLVAVPLSSIILYAEIALIALSPIPLVAIYLGKLVAWLLAIMNAVVRFVNQLPFAVWDQIQSTILSTWLLYALVIAGSVWLLRQNKPAFRLSLYLLLFFIMAHAVVGWQTNCQQKLVIYNVPQHQAIDLVHANKYQFIGDSTLETTGILQNFHLKPARIHLSLIEKVNMLPGVSRQNQFIRFNGVNLLIVDRSLHFESVTEKINVDIILVSHNPKIAITQLAAVFNCKQYVFDASNSLWKIDKWLKECEELHLRSHSTPVSGAFIMNVE